MTICYYCGKESGNYNIWYSRSGFDPPDCYCRRGNEKKQPCKTHNCYEGVTQYPCKNCGK